MKKILIIIFLLNFSKAFAAEFSTNFNQEIFKNAQDNGKTVVVYSWNKYCGTCAKQKPIISEAKKYFKDVVFLDIEHEKNKDLVKNLNINFWSTIAVYKGNKQIASAIGITDKNKIYSLIQKGI